MHILNNEWLNYQASGLYWESEGWPQTERCSHLWDVSPSHWGETGGQERVFCSKEIVRTKAWRGVYKVQMKKVNIICLSS